MKILFICTHNRCRSILAEAICNHYGDGLLQAVSAGSRSVGKVHPLTINALKDLNISTENLVSQSWDAYEDAEIDYVITVCDKAANEPCPVWFGQARQAHWGLEDPSAIEAEDYVEGYAETINAAFTNTIEILKRRIEQITTWLKQGLDKDELFKRIETLT
ncbi:MAG: arsenate reductase ArsC [Gammaproteobacteria bacterium]|jgi:arsenate reductase (thioredoxin)|nr:arsenate reductase ArsC [Gammaproteobacteria bacterium]